MEAQKVEAAHGWLWITHGYRLIMRNPLMSLALALLLAVCLYLAMSIPLVGPPAALLLMPVLLAGYVRVCRALEFSQKVEPVYLFAGFQQRTAQLLGLGGLTMAGMLLISMIITTAGGTALVEIMEILRAAKTPDMPMETMLAVSSKVTFGLTLGLIVGLALLILLTLSLQLAPMLVFFEQMAPLDAMKASLAGILRNIVPFVIYSLILQGFAVMLSFIPFGLGLLIALPLGLTSLYVCYRDIFPGTEKHDSAAQPAGEAPPAMPD
jgi:hypothetical protein